MMGGHTLDRLDRHILAEAAQILASSLDPERVLQRFTELLVPAFGDVCAIFVPSEAGGARLACHAHANPDDHAGAEALYARFPIATNARTPVLRVLETGRPELYETVSSELLAMGARGDDHLDAMRAMGVCSVIFVPLVGRARTLAVLSLVSTRRERSYGTSDVAFAHDLARLAALALENTRLIESERRARDAAERLSQLTAALAEVVSAEEAAARMACAVRGALRARMAFVWLRSESGSTFELVAYDGCNVVPEAWRAVACDEDSPLVEAIEQGAPVLFASESERVSRYPARTLNEETERLAWAILPIASHGRTLGGVALGFTAPREFPEDERETMAAMARQCASTIERVELFSAEKRARTELVETNRMLEALIEASPAAILLLDGSLTVRLWNRSAERMFGWSSSEILGRSLPSHEGKSELAAILARTARGEPANGIELQQLRRDGVALDVALWAAPISPPGGAPLCLVVLIDVTDRKRAEEAARDASRRKDELIAMLSHELRNPLAPILTALELMKIDDGPAADEARRVIERQAKHLVRLVDDLLDLSRVTRGKIQLALEDVELAEVVARAVEMTSPLLEEQAHVLELDVPRTGLVVRADPLRLAQVMQNLLSNSAKYTPARGRIAVRARRRGDRVEVTVEDDGAGIAPELLPSLFDPFVQGARTIDRAQGGLGIGLTLVHSLVSLHGGTVAAKSDGVGRGTVLTVELPVAARERAPRAAPPERGGEARQIAGPGLRVLVVDDNADAAEMLAILLRRRGHVVEVAHDGPSALAIFDRVHPDAALLDIGLPVMDGYELARHMLRRAPGELLLVAVTGYGQEADRERSHEVGFAHHLVKPIKMRELFAILAAHARLDHAR